MRSPVEPEQKGSASDLRLRIRPLHLPVTMFQSDLYRNLLRITPADAPCDDYGKMFVHLPSFDEGQDPADVIERLRTLGRKGGPMDALDPKVTVTNPLDSNNQDPDPRNPDNTNDEMTVGFTFLGQFLDHDITFDPAPLNQPAANCPNLRNPFLDLDSVYGRGPMEDRLLYDRTPELGAPVPDKFLIDFEAPHDLPRTSQQRAIIADPRNDENVIISQLHLAFLKFHNRVVDWVIENPTGDPATDLSAQAQFERARLLVRWHYQWIAVKQFLRVTLDIEVFDELQLNGPTLFPVSATPTLPREFQVATYRFGHSQIRPGYKINHGFGAPIFDPDIDPKEGDPNDLRGGRRAERRFVEWDTFFDFGNQEVAAVDGVPVARPKVKKNKRIDPFISSPMFDLPVGPGLVGPGDELRSLAGRNLERHRQHQLASGQAVAAELGYAALGPADFPELVELNFHESTPLWYYILKEALVQQSGERLGKVGSRIIAEVFFGLLQSDATSYVHESGWQPVLPRRDGSVGDFTMVDLLTFAGVA